jgi:hypothetical protein
MKRVPLLFQVTSAVIFLQLLLGGLLTFDFIAPTIHIITGFIVFILAVATMVVVLVSKPIFRPLRGLSIGLVALIVVQIILGFEALRTSSSVVAWVHFVVAMGIYGMAIAGNFMAMSWDQMTKIPTVNQKPSTTTKN